MGAWTDGIKAPDGKLRHCPMNVLSDSRNAAGHNDTSYVVLVPSGEKLHTIQYKSVLTSISKEK